MKKASRKGVDWTDQEIDLVVAEYFNMLRMDNAGEAFVKARRNEALQELTGRSRGSIDYKLENISAVLGKLGIPPLRGYQPMPHVQGALVEAVNRFLTVNNEFLDVPLGQNADGLADGASLYFEQAPSKVEPDADDQLPELKHLVRKFDPASRDARNRALGERGEEVVLASEIARLRSEGRDDLARRVCWVAKDKGDGAGYDILSFSPTGRERLLEVKTTTGYRTTPFYLSENERALSAERPDAFRLVRLYDFSRQPRAFQLVPPLEDSVLLKPANYRASFGP